MLNIYYWQMVLVITALWCAVRAAVATKNKTISWKREAQLILVYICVVVVARFTFFPFSKVNGQIQPLVFSAEQVFPVRLNLIPMVNLLDYPNKGEVYLNVIGNTTMFLPLGIVWPCVFRKLNTHKKAILAGVGVSLLIEILQLPFYDRVTDIDDLILNSLGYLAGYGILLLVRTLKKKKTA